MTGAGPAERVWLNGRLTLPAQARLDPTDRGFLLGDGLFETMRAVSGRVPLSPATSHGSIVAAGCSACSRLAQT